jgi:hypothetical protein
MKLIAWISLLSVLAWASVGRAQQDPLGGSDNQSTPQNSSLGGPGLDGPGGMPGMGVPGMGSGGGMAPGGPGMGSGGGMALGGSGMGGPGMGYDYGNGMGGMGDGPMIGPDGKVISMKDYRFMTGLGTLLDRLSKASSDSQIQQLKESARKAFKARYAEQLQARESKIAELEAQIADLKIEQQRRADAADRVVDLQMQSLELAAEGLMDRQQFIRLGTSGWSPKNDATSSSGYGGDMGAYRRGGGYPGMLGSGMGEYPGGELGGGGFPGSGPSASGGAFDTDPFGGPGSGNNDPFGN